MLNSFDGYLHFTYSNELEIKDTTNTHKYASFLDIHPDLGHEERLKTKLYNKRDDFNFPIVRFSMHL